MKKLFSLILLCFVSSGNLAADATYQDLINKLEHAVKTMATGDVADGFGTLEEGGNKPPKERAADLDKVRSSLAELKDSLGASRRINRISLVFLGDSYLRVRFMDRRETGGIIWTFFCEKNRDEWDLCSSQFSGNSDLIDLARDTLDAADYTKEPPKELPPPE